MKIIHETDSEIFYLRETDSELVKTIQAEHNITELTARILVNRGVHSLGQIQSFLSPLLRNLPDPFLFKDMRKIVERIHQAIINEESILVYGDYDVDGITSTSLMVNFFNCFDYPIRYYIPDRFQDGYGLNSQRLQALFRESPFQLLITVDCGISGEEAIAVASELGVDTIITDHHRAREKPKGAIGVLDPSLQDCTFPFKDIAGVGVVFFLLIALRHYLREKGFWESRRLPEPDLRDYLDIVSIGTISDMVPLMGINRILVTSGLKILSNTKREGLKRFLDHLGLIRDMPVTPWEVSFQIAPRLNAAGRLSSGILGVELLTTSNTMSASQIINKLEHWNRQRQAIENRLLEDARKKIGNRAGFVSPFAIVLWGETWHEGVIGIVASKLVESYGRPIALISTKKEEGKGSLRGIAGVDIFQALQGCQSLLISHGGHKMAGGIRIETSNLTRFASEFSNQIASQLNGQTPKKRWILDFIIENDGISDKFFEELPSLEPFGIGNPSPLLGFFDFQILSKQLIKDKHIRLTLQNRNGKPLKAIAFNSEEMWDKVDTITGIIGNPGINYWNGNSIPQITIKKFIR